MIIFTVEQANSTEYYGLDPALVMGAVAILAGAGGFTSTLDPLAVAKISWTGVITAFGTWVSTWGSIKMFGVENLGG